MNVSNVRVHPVSGDRGLEAVAGFIVDDWLVIRDVKVIRRNSGDRFLSMPQRVAFTRCVVCLLLTPADSNFCCRCGVRSRPKSPCGLLNTVHPATSEARSELTAIILQAVDARKVG